MKLLLISFLLLAGECTWAAAFILPVGHKEAFMASTGIAYEDSPGNPIYNPAGIGFRKSKDLSLTVSATALEKQRFELSGNFSDDSTGSDLNIRPMLAAGIYPLWDGQAAVFVANPAVVQIAQSQSENTDRASVRFSMNSDNIQGGVAYAALLNPDLSVGLALGIEYNTQKVYTYASQFDGAVAKTQYQQVRSKQVVLYLMPAVMWKATDWWTLGFTVQSAPVHIDSNADSFSSTTDSSNPTQIATQKNNFDPAGREPVEVSLGQQFKFLAQHIYLDLIYATASTGKDAAGSTLEQNDGWGASLGWRTEQFERLQPMAGVSYGKLPGSENYLYTAGVSIPTRQSELVLGGYYQKNVALESGSSPFESIGILFSTSVDY